MAEDEEKKEEESLEADDLSDISLEQARQLALDHARENRDFFGRRYRRGELVWEIVDEEEDEDYYRILLSFRPAVRFKGSPGTEQFVIEKTGEIRLRQLLDEPVRQGVSNFFIPAVGVALIVAALGTALAVVVFANNGPPPPVTPALAVATPVPSPVPTETSVPVIVIPATNVPTTVTADAPEGISEEDIKRLIAQVLAENPGRAQLTPDEVDQLVQQELALRRKETPPTPIPTATLVPTPAPTETPLPPATATPVPTPTATPLPTPTPIPTPTPTPTPVPPPTATPTPAPPPTPTRLPYVAPGARYTLSINGSVVKPLQRTVEIGAAVVLLRIKPNADGKYRKGETILMTAYPKVPGDKLGYVRWGGVDVSGPDWAKVEMTSDRFITIEIR